MPEIHHPILVEHAKRQQHSSIDLAKSIPVERTAAVRCAYKVQKALDKLKEKLQSVPSTNKIRDQLESLGDTSTRELKLKDIARLADGNRLEEWTEDCTNALKEIQTLIEIAVKEDPTRKIKRQRKRTASSVSSAPSV